MIGSDVHIELRTIVSSATHQGIVELKVNDTTVQMPIDKARQVARMLGEAIEAAISDQVLVQFLLEKVGIDPASLGSILSEFRELRQGSRATVFLQ